MTKKEWMKEIKKSLIDKEKTITNMASDLGITTQYIYMAYQGNATQDIVDKISCYCGIESIKNEALQVEQ